MTEKNDGYINWVEPKNIGFLPSDVEKDSLSVMLRLLVARVKEDHAKYQYKKDLKHYANEIVEIIRFARANGYKMVLHDNKISQISRTKTNIDADSLALIKNAPSIVENVDFIHDTNKKDHKEIVDA